MKPMLDNALMICSLCALAYGAVYGSLLVSLACGAVLSFFVVCFLACGAVWMRRFSQRPPQD